MTMETGTVGRLQSLIRLYHEGYRSPVIDQALGKLIALEVEQSQAELQRLEARLLAYEQKYNMTSAEFYQRFRSGELGDDMDFVEWSVFWDMHQATKRRLNELTKQFHDSD
jgi:tetrahydromethanopterin S-methyltransferase subunit G